VEWELLASPLGARGAIGVDGGRHVCRLRAGATLDAIAPPKSGVARVFVLRDKAFAGIIDTGFQAYLDEAPMGDLKTGTFVYRDVPAGPHKLFFARPLDMFRGSHQEFSAAPGGSYYFRLELNDKGKWITASTVVAGMAGALASSAVGAAADDRGLFDFTPLDDATARAAMAELRLNYGITNCVNYDELRELR
jgi:hypothetical protein